MSFEFSYLLVLEEVLEVIELLAGVSNFVGATVETGSVLLLTSGSIVGEHSVAVLHGEDLVVDSTVVTILVSQVI